MNYTEIHMNSWAIWQYYQKLLKKLIAHSPLIENEKIREEHAYIR
jgi:hypothetical protein